MITKFLKWLLSCYFLFVFTARCPCRVAWRVLRPYPPSLRLLCCAKYEGEKKVQDLHHLRSAAFLRSHSLSDSHISGNSKFRLSWTGSMADSCWTKWFSDLTMLCPTIIYYMIFPCLKGTNTHTIIFCLLELQLVLVRCTNVQPPFQIIDSAQNPKWLKRDQTNYFWGASSGTHQEVRLTCNNQKRRVLQPGWLETFTDLGFSTLLTLQYPC